MYRSAEVAVRRDGQYNCHSSQFQTFVVRPTFEGSVSRKSGKLDWRRECPPFERQTASFSERDV